MRCNASVKSFPYVLWIHLNQKITNKNTQVIEIQVIEKMARHLKLPVQVNIKSKSYER